MSHLSFGINANSDLYLDRGRLALVRDQEALSTVCTQVASTRRGEIIFYENRGIPFFEQIWNGTPNLMQFQAALTLELLKINGVKSVPQCVAVLDNDVVKYSAIINTEYGDATITNE